VAPGEAAAAVVLRSFLRERLPRYAVSASDPNAGAVSGLSPYLHFGQISPRRVALAVREAQAPVESKDRFLEELIVRRELSDNFCRFEPACDTLACAPAWAKATLEAHRDDRRPYAYDLAALENARTHDPLWNAAQVEMVRRGGMHGYLRMYWAKKILEWSPTPEEAFAAAVELNDRYQLDGRDPNGYAGIAWSVAGVHDRPWPERPIFGKIRCMTLGGCRTKFDVDAFIRSAEDS
jgi:deoxyribodipyrimidine photo-lyase